MIGLSFLDLSNTSKDEEFLRDTWSLDVASSGGTTLLHGVAGIWYDHFAFVTEYFDVLD